MNKELIQLNELQKELDSMKISKASNSDLLKVKKELEQWQKDVKGDSYNRDDLKEWVRNVNDWMDSFKKVGIFKIVATQFLFGLLMYSLSYTQFGLISSIYFIFLPAILSVQGEMWKNGVGQFISLDDRDMVDSILRTILLVLSLLSVVSLAITMNVTYEWFIHGLVIFTISNLTFVPDLIYYITDAIRGLIEYDQDDYERRYKAQKYGWYYTLFPFITILSGLLVGTGIFYAINWVESYHIIPQTGKKLRDVFVKVESTTM